MAPNTTNYGDDSLTDQRARETGIWEDIKALGPDSGPEVLALMEELLSKGKPYADRTMMAERVIQLTASLPRSSKLREKLSTSLVKIHWGSLQHPPQSYYGDEFQYRTADGSYNNVMIPHLGKAGMPYAKSVRSVKGLHGAKPDPGLLFDLLMARPDGKFRENEAGINSILFYHATVIIHDLFRTNRLDSRISDTSSYLDLSPLYGKDQAAQDTVRTFKDGRLKPDTFAEERLLGQPPGSCVMLIMYNRFHNYVAENLAAINEDGRFSLPRQDSSAFEAGLKKRDNDLFQTARLVVCGLYMNITLHDYIRAIINIHHSDSSWTMDPRGDIINSDGSRAVERGVGNQVSAEFNLLYRFHSAVSQRDAKWTAKFFGGIYGDKRPEDLDINEFIAGVAAFESKIPSEPSERVFGGLTRDPNTGCFDDGAMVQILKDSMEDPAGAFGARNVPKNLRIVEILGILQSRKWQSATLNEFRQFFGLKVYDKFEEINPDPEIADLLRKLYDSPDMVELYPGFFVEENKPRMDPGSGIGINFTAGRAVLSDAVGFIRGDRFYTVDYTSATLTPWGMAEVQQDYDILGGSMLYRLIHRAFPGRFQFNSIYVMQPMYTPATNQEIAKKFGTLDQYSLASPVTNPKLTILDTQAAISLVMNDHKNFKASYENKLSDLQFADFLLCGDYSTDRANQTFLGTRVANCPGGLNLFSKSIESTMRKILARESYKLKDIYQVDMSKDVARVVMVHVHAEFLNLPLAADREDKNGLSEEEMYRHLETYVNYILIDNDPAESWRLRRQAKASYEKLKAATEGLIHSTQRSDGFLGHVFGGAAAPSGSLREMGQKLTKDLLHAGYSVEKTATTLYSIASSGVAPTASLFVQILDWLLRAENAKHWAAVRALVAENTASSYDNLKKYLLEAGRYQSFFSASRVCISNEGVTLKLGGSQDDHVTLKKGDVVLANYSAATQDPKIYPDPKEFKLERPIDSYQLLGWEPHPCIGRDIVIVALASMVKVSATLKNLRRAPGPQGQVKFVPGPLGSKRFLSDDWSHFQPFPGAWKVHFDNL